MTSDTRDTEDIAALTDATAELVDALAGAAGMFAKFPTNKKRAEQCEDIRKLQEELAVSPVPGVGGRPVGWRLQSHVDDMARRGMVGWGHRPAAKRLRAAARAWAIAVAALSGKSDQGAQPAEPDRSAGRRLDPEGQRVDALSCRLDLIVQAIGRADHVQVMLGDVVLLRSWAVSAIDGGKPGHAVVWRERAEELLTERCEAARQLRAADRAANHQLAHSRRTPDIGARAPY